MAFEIFLAPEAIEDLKGLKANVRADVRDAIARHLRNEPRKETRSRIKRLKGVTRPEYRLRVGDIRVFFDVTRDRVEVLAIVSKEGAQEWLARLGKQS